MNDDPLENAGSMVTELVFTTSDVDYPLVRLTRRMDVSVTILDWIQSTRPPYRTSWFLAVSTDDTERVVRTLRAGGRTEAVWVLDDRPNECLLQVTVVDSVSRSIADAGALLWSTHAAAGEGTLTVVVPPSGDSEATAETILQDHPSLTLTSIRTRPVTRSFLTRRSFQHLLQQRLTERQWEVLGVAYQDGYFERPRQSTQQAIAGEMDISQETVSQHLRAAQRALLEVVFGGDLLDGSDPDAD